jgi:hypothetical protein
MKRRRLPSTRRLSCLVKSQFSEWLELDQEPAEEDEKSGTKEEEPVVDPIIKKTSTQKSN